MFRSKYKTRREAWAGQAPLSRSGAKAGAKNGGPVKAKRVIDAKATEVLPDDASDDGAEVDGAPADAVGTPSSPARNRPRRKKRRR